MYEIEILITLETIIIKSKSKSNAELIIQLVERMGDEAKILSKEQTEDVAFGLLMKKSKTGENVSRDVIMQKLKNE